MTESKMIKIIHPPLCRQFILNLFGLDKCPYFASFNLKKILPINFGADTTTVRNNRFRKLKKQLIN